MKLDVAFFGAAVCALSITLTGCATIPLSDISDVKHLLSSTSSCQNTAKLLQANSTFAFLLPPAARGNSKTITRAGVSARYVSTFADYAEAVKSTVRLLPKKVQFDSVTTAVMDVMIAASAQAQVKAAQNAGLDVGTAPADVQSYVDHVVPKHITYRELKRFSRAMSKAAFRPILTDSETRTVADAQSNAFTLYFEDYYGGTFVDRLGNSIQKPQIAGTTATLPLSITIPDADIAAAISVLVEYLADLVDPTPVLGDTPTLTVGATKFYPGGHTDEPTALSAKLATYVPLSNTCLSADDTKILSDVANAAGDEAQTVGGLVSQSFGGIGISLGVFGKISIGDNQTLATIAKTAASRLATRAAFSAAYWSLSGIMGSAPKAGAKPAGPNGVLQFF